MSGKAAVVKSLLEMGVQVDPRQNQSQLESQLERLEIKRCLSEASGIELINLCRKYDFDTRRSQDRRVGKLLKFYQKNKHLFNSDFPSPPSSVKSDDPSAAEVLDSAGLPLQDSLDSAGLPGKEVLGSSGTGH